MRVYGDVLTSSQPHKAMNVRMFVGKHFPASPFSLPNREKWRKLVAKSSVVPQRPSWLKDWWWWWWGKHACVCACYLCNYTTDIFLHNNVNLYVCSAFWIIIHVTFSNFDLIPISQCLKTASTQCRQRHSESAIMHNSRPSFFFFFFEYSVVPYVLRPSRSTTVSLLWTFSVVRIWLELGGQSASLFFLVCWVFVFPYWHAWQHAAGSFTVIPTCANTQWSDPPPPLNFRMPAEKLVVDASVLILKKSVLKRNSWT